MSAEVLLRTLLPALIAASALAACEGRCGLTSPADDDTSDTDRTTDTDPTADTDDSDPTGPTDDTDDSDVVAEPTCVLGAGDGSTPTTWPALTEGAEVGVFRGGQGRWHVFGLVRCDGLVGGGQGGSASSVDLANPDNPTVTWGVYDQDDVLMAGYEALRRPMTRASDIGLVNELLVFWTAASFEDSIDRDATLRFTLTDVAGGSWSAELPVRLVDGAPDDTDPVPDDTDGP